LEFGAWLLIIIWLLKFGYWLLREMEPEHLITQLKNRLEGETVDAFEICFIGGRRLSVEARDGMVESLARADERGVAVRVIKDKKMGWASSTDLSDEALTGLVESAVISMHEVSPSEESQIAYTDEKKSGPAPRLNEKKGRPLEGVLDDEKIEIALSLEREAKAADRRITRVRQPLYEERVRHVMIFNSNGMRRDFRRAMTACEVRAIAESNGRSESGWEFHFSPRFDDLNAEEAAKTAAGRALSMLGAGSLHTGKYTVVFDSRAAANLVRLIAPSFFANNIQRKKSSLAGKKGERIYHEGVTIIDDGLMPDGYGSFPFDDEGVPRRKNFLVKDGIIVDWLYDQARAARDKRGSTGSSYRASIHDSPSINVSNCYLSAGTLDQEKLFSKTGNGFFVSELMGLHTANPVTGDFSLGAEGFLIENGRKGRPIRGVMVAGNVHELFKNIEAVGSDLKFIASYGAPSILVPAVQISGGS
jgi:PmbA protein